MRERGLEFREWGQAVGTALWRHRLTIIAFAGGGALMAHVGAFHTGGVPALVRFPYFIGLNLAGGLFTVVVAMALHRRAWFATKPLARVAIQAAAVTVLLTPLVWIAAALLLNGDTSPLRMLDLAKQVAPAAALFSPMTLLVPPQPPLPSWTAPRPSAAASSPLQAALPPGMRTATIHAVEGHDHYLRVHTDRGSALVTLRLSDAVASLESVDGARTHRSWWVAREAIRTSRRKRGRAMLGLCNGLTVPVSRTYAASLRDAGWF